MGTETEWRQLVVARGEDGAEAAVDDDAQMLMKEVGGLAGGIGEEGEAAGCCVGAGRAGRR